MKKIFDELREQMKDRIKAYQTLDVTETAVDVAIKETERFVEYINEAEAKWEAELCEWKLDKEIYSYDSSCGHYLDNHGFKFCPYCGKPIKIVEVE